VHRTVEYVLGLVSKARGQVLGLVRIVGKRGGGRGKCAEPTSKQKSHFGFKE